MKVIRIAEDFSRYPGGRYPDDGPGNGTAFRESFLVPVLDRGEKAQIVLDGAQGYPSSFLEEAFGGLVRIGYSREKVLETFEVVANQPGYSRFIPAIKKYVMEAEPKTRA